VFAKFVQDGPGAGQCTSQSGYEVN
jgi:hypothetical protein